MRANEDQSKKQQKHKKFETQKTKPEKTREQAQITGILHLEQAADVNQ